MLHEKPELPVLLQFRYKTRDGPIIAWLLGWNRKGDAVCFIPSQTASLKPCLACTPADASGWVSGGHYCSADDWLTPEGTPIESNNFNKRDKRFTQVVASIRPHKLQSFPATTCELVRHNQYQAELLDKGEVRKQRNKVISLINQGWDDFTAEMSQVKCKLDSLFNKGASKVGIPRGEPSTKKVKVERDKQVTPVETVSFVQPAAPVEEFAPAELPRKKKTKKTKDKDKVPVFTFRTPDASHPPCSVYVNEEIYTKIQALVDDQVEKMKDLNVEQVKEVIKSNTIYTNDLEIDMDKQKANPVPIQVITGGSLVKIGTSDPSAPPAKPRFPPRKEDDKVEKVYTIKELAPDDPDGLPLDEENEKLEQALYQSNIIYHYRYKSPKLMKAFKSYIEAPIKTATSYNTVKKRIEKRWEKLREKPTEIKMLQWLCFPWVQTGLLNHPNIHQNAEMAFLMERGSLKDIKTDPLFSLLLNTEYKKAEQQNLKANPYRPELLEITHFQRVGPIEEFRFLCKLSVGEPIWIHYIILVQIPAYQQQLQYKYKWFMNIEKCLNFEDDEGYDLVDPDLVLPDNHKDQFDRMEMDMSDVKFSIKKMTPTRLRVKESNKKTKKLKRGILLNALDHEELQLEKAMQKAKDNHQYE